MMYLFSFAGFSLKDGGPTIQWSFIQPSLEAAECDVLLILDCCFAGQAARARTSHKVEMLAAAAMGLRTPAPGQKFPSFTKVLIAELIRMVQQEEKVDIRVLHREMLRKTHQLQQQPIHVSLSGDPNGSIVLRELKTLDTKRTERIPTEDMFSLDLRVSLFETPSNAHKDQILRWLTTLTPSVVSAISVEKVFHEGEQRIQQALSKFHSFRSFGQANHLVFGINRITRSLADSAEGMNSLLVCSALTEAHSTIVSVEILQEFANLNQPDDKTLLMLSLDQWKALLSSSSGFLSTSAFGSVVEFFLRLESVNVKPLSGDPKQIAKALEGIAKLSRGLMKSMVLEGNSECAFLAAFAHWILDLRVTVKNSELKTVFPITGSDPEDWQLLVIFSNQPAASRGIIQGVNTYYIDKIINIFRQDDANCYHLSGRVEWTNAVSHTFGAAAKRLFAMPRHLGELIGCAAKIYAVHLTKFVPKPYEPLPQNGKFGAESSGRAFVDLALRSLPELENSQSSMRAAVELSYKDAMLGYEKTFVMMKEICGCSKWCSKPSEDSETISLGDGGFTSGPRARSTFEYDPSDETSFCLPLLAMTIIQLVRQLSTVGQRPTDLLPKRRGIQSIYEAVEHELVIPASGPDTIPSDSTHLLEAMNTRDLLSVAALVFTAYDDTSSSYEYQHNNDISVRAVSGLCFLLDSVLNLSDKPENMLRMHIIPGSIECKGRLYSMLRDGIVTSPSNILAPLVLPSASAEYKTQMALIDSLTARAVVSEPAGCLRLTYEIRTKSGTCYLAPKDLSINMTYAANRISCHGKHCKSFKGLVDHFLFTLHPVKLPYYDRSTRRNIPSNQQNKPNIVLVGNNTIACCLALNRFQDAKVILQGDECIHCCARRVMMLEDFERVVIVSGLTVEKLQRSLGDSITLVA